MNQEKIGQFIKDIRKRNNLTQEAFASQLGVTYQAVSKWETGKSIPDIAILKNISELYNINIDELIKGEKKRLNKREYMIIAFSMVAIIALIIVIIVASKNHHDFEFKTLSTTCEDFTINGSAAYNKDKTSIYISNINYCGKDNDVIYKTIECNLYEKYNNTTTLVSGCDEKKHETTLELFLKDVEINVDNYSATCKKFQDSNLYLEIKAYMLDGKVTSYEIPLKLKDNC